MFAMENFSQFRHKMLYFGSSVQFMVPCTSTRCSLIGSFGGRGHYKLVGTTT